MRAGRLRHWLAFEVLSVEQDSDGAQVEAWLPAFSTGSAMPCEVVALSGRELLAAQAVQSKVTTRIKVRHRPGFDAVQRVRTLPAGPIYNIEAIIPDPDSRIRFVTLLCSSGINAGGTAT